MGGLKFRNLKYLILIGFVTFTTILRRLSSNFFVVLLEGGKILTGFGEFTFFHTLSDVPVNEGTLGVHKVELVVEAGEDFGNGGRVGDHADGALHLGKVATRDNGRRLVVDTALETGRAPVNELNGSLGLDGSNRGVDVLRDNITTVHKAASHVFTVTRVALGHHGGGLKGRVGDLGDGELLVVSLLGADDRSVRGKHKVDTRVRHQVGLKLSDIDVEGTIETKGGGQRGNNLGNETVQVGVGRTLDIQRATADVVKCFVVKHDSNIGVLEEGVGGKDRVVRLDNCSGHLGRRVHGETELRLLTVVHGETLQKERSETGTGTSTDGVEDHETLKTGTVVGQLTDSVEGEVNNFLTNGVVTTGVVVGGVLLTGDQLLGVEQLTVGTSTNLVNDGRLKVQEDGTGDVLASTSLGKESVESVIATADGLVSRHLAIRLETVLNAVKLPAGVTNRDRCLSLVYSDYFYNVCYF
jgi:hypothetical protein